MKILVAIYKYSKGDRMEKPVFASSTTTIRMERGLHRWVRDYAWENKTNVQAIINKLLRQERERIEILEKEKEMQEPNITQMSYGSEDQQEEEKPKNRRQMRAEREAMLRQNNQ